MWEYNNKIINSIEDFGEVTPFGFVYQVTHMPSGKKYIGKKVLYHNKKVPIGKKELASIEGKGRRPSKKLIIKESDWKSYYGSNKTLKELVSKEPKENFKKEILALSFNKKLLTYLETKMLFQEEVLFKPDEYFNDNILGRYFSVDFNGKS